MMVSRRLARTARSSYGLDPRLAAALLVFTFAACSKRYYVRPDHLDMARRHSEMTGNEVALPAFDLEGRPAYLEFGAVRALHGFDSSRGLLIVRARDSRRILRMAGWVLSGAGAGGAILGALILASSPAPSEGEALRQLFGGGLLVMGTLSLAVGVPLLLGGYLSNGAEADGPTPGMPTSVWDPPVVPR